MSQVNIPFKYPGDDRFASEDNQVTAAINDNDARINQLLPIGNTFKVELPKEIRCVVGDTIQIYYRSMFAFPNPEAYYFVSTLAGAKDLKRYVEYIPLSPTTTTMTVNAYNINGDLVNSNTVSIIVKSAVKEPTSNVNVWLSGDSLTNNPTWGNEFLRRLTGTGGTPAGNGFGNITYFREGFSGKTWNWMVNPTADPDVVLNVTSHDKDDNDINSVWQDANGEQWELESSTPTSITFARLGGNVDNPPSSGIFIWVSGGTHQGNITYQSITAGIVNPFWNYTTNLLDIENYRQERGQAIPDVVYILLTWNGMASFRSDADWITWTEDVYTLIDQYKSDFPDVKIKLMSPQFPSQTGGLGWVDGANVNGYPNQLNQNKNALKQSEIYERIAGEAAYSSWVEHINTALRVDSLYNAPFVLKDVNSRNSTTQEIVGNNDVHPKTEGYYQIADVAYSSFIHDNCQ